MCWTFVGFILLILILSLFEGDLILSLSAEYRNKRRISVFTEIIVYFFIATIFIGVTASITVATTTTQSVLNQKEQQAESIFDDLEAFLNQYESIDFLLKYWLDHKDTLDVQYDTSIITSQKFQDFGKRNSNFSTMMATVEQIEQLPDSEQKVYAEIAYNRIITRFNHIKKAFDVDYIFCLAVDDDFKKAIFLLSGNDGSMNRSSKFGDAYTLGTTVDIDKDQIESFQKTVANSFHSQKSKDYVDRYETYRHIEGYHIFVGITYGISEVKGEIAKQTVRGALLIATFQIVFAIVSLGLIHKYVLIPLFAVQKSVESYQKNKDSKEVIKRLSNIRLGNEIGMLSESFSDMVLTLDKYIVEVQTIAAEKQRIDTELNVATRIQKDMLPIEFPPFPDRDEFEVYASMSPAKEVGGDFYDYFFIDENHLVLEIADVSGKGVPAALFMVISKTLMKLRASSGRGTPAEWLYDVNNTLCERNEAEFFVTVWIAVIDVKTGKGIAANAGHEHPILRHKGGEFEAVIYKHSQPLGMLENVSFREHEFLLEPGDSLFEYTDGTTEAENINHELFGMNRCVEALNKCSSNDPRELIATVRKDIDSFVAEADQFDDITMLSFYFKGQK